MLHPVLVVWGFLLKVCQDSYVGTKMGSALAQPIKYDGSLNEKKAVWSLKSFCVNIVARRKYDKILPHRPVINQLD